MDFIRFLCGLSFAWFASLVSSENVLKQVNVFYRHGARSPTYPYPTDPHQDSWPEGLGQLTTLGKQQAYDLGLFLKRLFIDTGFLDPAYNAKQLYARSTDSDRTLMSGSCALNAMFPPGQSPDQPFNTDLGWQPVPLHTVNAQDDLLLNMDTPPCPSYDKLRSDFYSTEEFTRFNSSYEELYEYLRNYSGITAPMSPFTAWNVYDTYLCEITNGLTPPAWITEEAMNTVVNELIPFQYLIDFGTVEKTQLKAGLMVDQIIKNMEASIRGELDNSTRMFMYSAHDDNIILLLMSLNLYEYTYITYTSTLIYELYHSTTEAQPSVNDAFVKILFKNNSYSEPVALTIPGCTEMCPMSRFVELVTPYRLAPEERNELCGIETSSGAGVSITLVLAMAIVVAIALCLVLYLALRHTGHPAKAHARRASDVTTSFTNPGYNEKTAFAQDKPTTSYS